MNLQKHVIVALQIHISNNELEEDKWPGAKLTCYSRLHCLHDNVNTHAYLVIMYNWNSIFYTPNE